MPPSPYKRDRRTKSRLMGASDTDRANLRAKAVELMRGSRGRGMTPAEGSPDQDKQRLNRVRAAANRERQVTTDGGAPKDVTGRLILRRQDGGGMRMSNPPKASPKPPNPSPMGSAPAPGGIGRFRNRTNNPRRGLIGRRIPRPGGEKVRLGRREGPGPLPAQAHGRPARQGRPTQGPPSATRNWTRPAL
jgi:hypothetical protein